MAWENWLDLATVFISLVALGFAWISWRMSHHTDRRMVEIEEARDAAAKQESSRAYVTARMGEVDQNVYELTIGNMGPATARDVRLMLDGAPASLCKSGMEVKDSIACLGPMATTSFRFLPTTAARLPESIKITWEDDSDEPGDYESNL